MKITQVFGRAGCWVLVQSWDHRGGRRRGGQGRGGQGLKISSGGCPDPATLQPDSTYPRGPTSSVLPRASAI